MATRSDMQRGPRNPRPPPLLENPERAERAASAKHSRSNHVFAFQALSDKILGCTAYALVIISFAVDMAIQLSWITPAGRIRALTSLGPGCCPVCVQGRTHAASRGMGRR